jgi:2-desacetyl-2-hydroxyethyl bacteriochlorophyllide A dehydrogenase
METMRGAVLVEPYKIEIRDFPRPQVDDDTVLVKVAGIGICGSNLHWWTGGGPATRLMQFPMPGAGGHEFSGTVVEVGSRVRRVAVGDRVTVDQFESRSCGSCVYCAGGLFTQCTNMRQLGLEGFVEYLKFSERGLYKIPDAIETHVAALVQPYACSVSAVRRAGIAGGETVVVLGAGVLGLCAAATAKVLGAEKVILTAKYDAQKELAARFGADAVVPSNASDLVERVVAECPAGGADMVIETVGGHAPTLAQGLEIIRPAGKLVVLGLWDELVAVDSWLAILKDVTMMFVLNHGVIGRKADYELCLEWMASRKIPAQDLVTHVLPLAELEEAFRLAADKTRGAVKVIIRP